MENENKGTILYAEDERAVRTVFERFLKKQVSDFVIEPLEDGTSLEERLNAGVENVRLIITDNDMPGIKGSQIINAYARMESFSHMPFILFYAGDESIGEFLTHKYDNVSYLLKPAPLKDFLELIRESLAYSGGSSTQSSQ